MTRNLFFCALFILSLSATSCDDKLVDRTKFSYRNLIENEFMKGKGDPIPVTVEKGIQTDGDISRDGHYFYYASNRDRGTFDIYLRSLSDITTIRITGHSAKNFSPSLSPDGKYIAYVSTRDDPEGDIFVMKVDPGKMLKEYKTKRRYDFADKSTDNLTQIRDPESKVLKIVKDSNPSWSPDSKMIVFSSKRDGDENIWIMNRGGGDLRKLTKSGGMYPAFSPDGTEVVYVSYRDSSNGEIYTIDLETGEEKRITKSDRIKLYPGYRATGDEIIYTMVAGDTNSDGVYDLKDNTVIQLIVRKTGEEYPLTLASGSAFAARWAEAFSDGSGKQGVIIYSEQKDDSINLKVIPGTGIIPKFPTVKQQYRFSEDYATLFKDRERYPISMEMVYHHFGSEKKRLSRIYTAKAMVRLYRYGIDSNNREISERGMRFLKKLSDKGGLYARALYDAYQKKNPLEREQVLRKRADSFAKSGKKKYITPYLLEDIAAIYFELKDEKSAVSVMNEIKKNYPEYERIGRINQKISAIDDRKLKHELSESALYIIENGTESEKISIKKALLAGWQKEKDISRRIEILTEMRSRYSDNFNVYSLVSFALSQALYESGDFNGALDAARKSVTQAKKNKDDKAQADGKTAEELKKPEIKIESDIIYYLANSLMGEVSLKNKKTDDAEKYYSAAALNYKSAYKNDNYKTIVRWLIDSYEEFGLREESAGNFKRAAELYRNYTRLMGYIIRFDEFSSLYNIYASRSHVLYIDAYIEWKGTKSLKGLEREYLKNIGKAKLNFDRAYLYGVAYFYTQKSIIQERKKDKISINKEPVGIDGLLDGLSKAHEYIDWAIFMDDTFVDPYILKSWIYMYVDLKRTEKKGDYDKQISEYFPHYLWEKNISILERALELSKKNSTLENQGNINLNIANNYFLLNNYPRALTYYKVAQRLKKSYDSKIEEALFYFHTGYCYWQMGELGNAREEINKSLFIYETLAAGKNLERYKGQIFTLYKYFALFFRSENDNVNAVKWYKKIVEFAEANRISIDRARYMQEIAHCYMENREYDSAIVYLGRAEEILKKTKDDSETFPMRIKLFGVLSVFGWDLGPDNLVIGENKIFSQLNNRDKKILNVSMYENIYSEKEDYSKAAEFLEKKIRLLKQKKHDLDREAIAVSINNLGYYHFKLKKYSEAIKNFRDAWDYSSDTKNNYFDGTITSIMNLANIYAYLLENSPESLKNPASDLENLISRILNFREKYEEQKFKAELDKKKKEAAARNKEIDENEIELLKKTISEEAAGVYFKADLATAIFQFYKAELASGALVKIKDGGAGQAFHEYSENKKIYEAYNSALLQFETAIESAQKVKKGSLYARLLLNAATCYSRVGSSEKALRYFNEVVKLSEETRLDSLKFLAFRKLGDFYEKYSGEEKPLKLAIDYYSKAVSMIESEPYLFAEKMNQVELVYNRLTTLLLRSAEADRSFNISEKRNDVIAALLFFQQLPVLSSEEDDADFRTYILLSRRIEFLKNGIFRLIEDGLGESEKKVSLDNELLRIMAERKAVLQRVGSRGSIIKSYLEIPEQTIPESDYVTYKLFASKFNLYVWKISGKKITVSKIDSGFTNESYLKFSAYLRKEGAKKARVIFNNDYLSLLTYRTKNDEPLAPHSLVPSLRLSASFKPSRVRPSAIHNRGGSLGKEILEYGYSVSTEKSDKEDLWKYSIIIDESKKPSVDQNDLYESNNIKPEILISYSEHFNEYEIVSYLHAAIYRGISTIVIASSGSSDTVSKMLADMNDKDIAISVSEPSTGDILLPFGITGFKAADKKEIAAVAEDRFKAYRELLSEGKMDDAKKALAKWHEVAGPGKSQEYFFELAIIDISAGKYDDASILIKSAVKSIPENDNNDWAVRFELLRLYILFHSGDFINGEKVLRKEAETLSPYMDYSVFEAISILIAEGKPEKALEKFKDAMKAGKSSVPAERLRLIFAEYLVLYGYSSLVPAVITAKDSDAGFTEREALKIRLAGVNIKPKSGYSRRIASLMSMASADRDSKLPDGYTAAAMKMGPAGYDRITPLQISLLLSKTGRPDNDIRIKSVMIETDFEQIAKLSYWMDFITALSLYADFSATDDSFTAGTAAYEQLIENLKKRKLGELQFLAYIKKGVNTARSGRAKSAYEDIAKAGDFIKKDDPDYNSYLLLLADFQLRSDNTGNLLKLIEEISTSEKLSKNDKSVADFIKAGLEIKALEKIKDPDVAAVEKVEKLMADSVIIFESDSSILKKYARIELFNRVIDQFISYFMRLEKFEKALSYSEIKKLMNAFVSFDKNGFSVNERIEYKEIMDKLKEDQVILSFSKNRKAVFVWKIDKKGVTGKIIEDATDKLRKIIVDYGEKSTRFTGMVPVSNELAKLFQPVKSFYSDKKTIFIETDRFMETVPFEILGEKEMLDESYFIAYLPSLKSMTASGIKINPSVAMINGRDERIFSAVEKSAVRISGIKYSADSVQEQAISHFISQVVYDKKRGTLEAGGISLRKINDNASTVYIPAVDFTVIGQSDFAIYTQHGKGRFLIINDAKVHDINNGIFVETFYSELKKGNSLHNSFDAAKSKIRARKRFKHPAYWSGIRLYIGGV